MYEDDILTSELTPCQQLAVRIALSRFCARYSCPCHDACEWRADCEAVAVVAVLIAETECHSELSPLEAPCKGLKCGSCGKKPVHQLWNHLDESKRQHVLWLARQAENALKRFWRQERRYYSHIEALVAVDEEGEWVEQEVEDAESLHVLQVIVEQIDGEQLLEWMWNHLDVVERSILAALREGKTQKEIADELGITQSAVAHRLQKIRAKARLVL